MKVQVKELDFAYDGNLILKAIDLEADEGKILALVGPNGSGKTTLLRNISGVLKPQKGVVYLDMQEIARLSPKEIAKKLAVLAQESRCSFNFTVREIVELGRLPHLQRFAGLSAEDHRAVEEAMRVTESLQFASRAINELSSGERQRVFLAMALSQEPKILLLDEPTSHLDINYQLEIMEIIRARADKGLTVIMAIHDLNLAASFADKIAMLHEGKLVAVGSLQEVLTEELISLVFGVEMVVRRDANKIYILPQRRVLKRC